MSLEMEVREWSTIGISWAILPEIKETLRGRFSFDEVVGESAQKS
jgi:hypothetical protein